MNTVKVRKQSSCSMQLTNKTDEYIAFKVKTTNPKKYCVRPNSGIVLPGLSCSVTVTMQGPKEIPPDMQCKDKFLLQSVIAPNAATNKDISPALFNKEDGKVIEEVKLRVVYIPANPPSPVPEGSEEGSSPRASVVEDGNQNAPLLDVLTRSLDETKEKASSTEKGVGHISRSPNEAISSPAIASVLGESLRPTSVTTVQVNSAGGDCKTMMFVQISPSVADSGETICSLKFASRVRGVEHGPARKQADFTELFKYKQLAEKAKHDEKETKKLQDNVQSLQLRLAAREHICRSLQEKVQDLENQLAEERKARQKQETRALAAVSAHPSALSSIKEVRTTKTEKKPPLGPTKLRLPLRRISNFLPQTPVPAHKTRTSLLPFSKDDKENSSMASTKAMTLLKPRRGSIAVRPPPQATNQAVFQPKRRASIATFRPESSSSMTTPLNNSSSVRLRTDRVMGRQSFVWDPQRVWRTSRPQSPLPQLKETSRDNAVEATPAGPRSSKFMGSPPSQAGSWKPKHPTVVALQRKQLVWSPLRYRSMKTNRKSLLLPS